MRFFCVCVFLCVGSGLATGLSLVQGVHLCKKMIMELKKRPGASEGSRAILYIYKRDVCGLIGIVFTHCVLKLVNFFL
jgi:hypothetical protein